MDVAVARFAQQAIDALVGAGGDAKKPGTDWKRQRQGPGPEIHV